MIGISEIGLAFPYMWRQNISACRVTRCDAKWMKERKDAKAAQAINDHARNQKKPKQIVNWQNCTCALVCATLAKSPTRKTLNVQLHSEHASPVTCYDGFLNQSARKRRTRRH